MPPIYSPQDLRTMRRDYDLRQRDVAQALSISVRQWQRYESGAMPIPHKLADQFGGYIRQADAELRAMIARNYRAAA